MARVQFAGQSSLGDGAVAANVRNGILLHLTSPVELARFVELCAEIRLPNFEPAINRTIPPLFQEADPFLVLAGSVIAGALKRHLARWNGVDDFAERILKLDLTSSRRFDALMLGMLGALSVWHSGEDEDLHCLLALELPGADEGVAVELKRPQAAFWLAPGSLLAGITVGSAIKATKWCALLARPAFSRTAKAASTRLIQDLRERGGLSSRYADLPRIDKLLESERKSISTKPVLLVFLHGLFGTDLGTFDGFISRLRSRPPRQLGESLADLQSVRAWDESLSCSGVKELNDALSAVVGHDRVQRATEAELVRFIDKNIAMVGWPHDSLAPIESCATQLAALLVSQLDPNCPRHLVFVSHSQGGLLARATALELFGTQSTVAWKTRVASIVTFGTPHTGAAIVESGFKGGQEAALYLMMLNGTHRFISLVDVLTVIQERKSEGLEDLKAFNASTAERETSFVRQLLKEELKTLWPNNRNRPDLFLVGGKLGTEQLDTWRKRVVAAFIEHKLGERSHDLVVEIDSSIPTELQARASVKPYVDHFGYFDESAPSAQAMDPALASIWLLLQPEVEQWRASLEENDKRLAAGRRINLRPTPRL